MVYKYAMGELFSNSPKVKIMEILCENYKNGCTMKDINRITEVPINIIRRHLANMVGMGIVTHEEYEDDTLFMLNPDNKVALYMILLENELVVTKLDKHMKQMGITPLPSDIFKASECIKCDFEEHCDDKEVERGSHACWIIKNRGNSENCPFCNQEDGPSE